MSDAETLALYEDAAFYDVEFATREHELPFFRRAAARTGGPILEVACGTGRLTVPLAEDGHEIVGLDLSAPMLERARKRAAAHGVTIQWVHADCRTMAIGRRFALIFSATGAMQHLLDFEAARAFLAAARDHLAPGGTLILDVFNPDIRKLARPPISYRFKQFTDAAGETITVDATSRYAADVQQLRFNLEYRIGDRLVREKRVTMRCFFPEELLALCRNAGFEVAARYGDYEESPFTADSARQIVVLGAASAPAPPPEP